MIFGADFATLLAAVAPLRALAVPWAVAGGWAIDLALGRVTREHHDVDVAVFRDDQLALRQALPAWRFDAVIGGEHRSWLPGVRLALPTHEIHAHPLDDRAPHLEFLLNERDGSDWVFRRDARVRRPIAKVLINTSIGLPALAPEVVMLYKANAPRPADELDFAAVVPRLGDEPRRWLAQALDRCHPAHAWRGSLR